MFHRIPLISTASVVTAAVILVLAALFALSLSSLGTALAEVKLAPGFDQEPMGSGDSGAIRFNEDSGNSQGFDAGPNTQNTYLCDRDDPDYDPTSVDNCPQVSIESITPEVGEEGSNLRITLQLSKALTADEKFCYPGRAANEEPRDEVCIQGGIIVLDNYDDHLDGESSGTADDLVKFVFRNDETQKRVLARIPDDSCITPGRRILVEINTSFGSATYGYTIDLNSTVRFDGTIVSSEHTVPVHGNDTTNTGFVYPEGRNGSMIPEGVCKAINEGDDEEVIANRAPAFGREPVSRSVAENTPTGEEIGSPVEATDHEGDTLTYGLTGTDAASFDIERSTGQIKTRAPLDRETKSSYHLAVTVSDGKNIYGNSNSAIDDSIDVTIKVTNVNEAPVFDANAPTGLNVVENTAAGEDIGSRVTATDPDVGDTLTYSLDTDDGAAFEIDTTNGQIMTKDVLDREAKDTYTVTVSVTDGKDAAGSADNTADDTRTVTIIVGNEVEPPTFDEEPLPGQSNVTRTVPENTPAGRPIGDPVSATSEDGVTLTYSLDDQDGASFDIDSNGQIKTKADLDYEDRSSYFVTVSVTDGQDAMGNTETTATEDDSIGVTINVTDVNEKPVFADDAPISQTVVENTAADTNIGIAYTATDDDEDTLTYSLGGTDAGSFAIDDLTGQLKTKAHLDYEVDSSYTVIVQVTDSRDDNGVAEGTPTVDDTHAVTITVTDQDDDGSVALSSDPPSAGTTVTATLEDQDGVKAGVAVTWLWETSSDQTNWSTITDATTDSYAPGTDDIGDYLRVTATYEDELGAGKTAQTVSGAILTAPPTNTDSSFADLSATRSVPENTAAGQPIGAPVAAVDPDNEDTLTYSLGGTDAASFGIDTSNGQLKTKDALDFDGGQTTYSVDVSVTDSKDDYDTADTLVDATIALTINVTDVNEKPVFADDAPISQTVVENTAADTNIGIAYTATDDDEDTLTYSLGGTDAGSFAIDDLTGQLKTKAHLDYEVDSSYTVIVQVTDSRDDNGVAEGTPTVDDTHAVTITVTDQDDDGSVALSSDPPSAGTTVTATLEDQDGVKAGVAVTWLWETSSDQTNWSTITDATTDSYAPGTDDIGDYLRVTATYEDELGAGKTAQTVSGAILTAPPTNTDSSFADLSATRSVPENTAAGQPIGAPVAAVDPDNEDTLTYSLGGTDAASFGIDTSNGQLKTKDALDFDGGQTTYSVDVSVTDSKDDYDTADTLVDATIALTINVTDVNEKPVFADDAVTALEVSEDTTIGVGIGEYEASDPDPSDIVTYSVSGTDAALFQVDPNGQLQVKEALDFETKPSLAVVVSTTDSRDDSGGTEQTPVPDDTVAITITLANVYEEPEFEDEIPVGETSITRSIPEDTAADQPVGLPVSATDDEGDTLTYELSGTDATSFNFDTATGQIKTKDELDYEAQETYSVTVWVSDGKDANGDAENTPQDDTYIDVTIQVTDVNEKPTFVATPPVEYQIAENTAAATPIGVALTATDPDNGGTDPNKDTLTYTLDSDSAVTFEIDTSGQIKTLAALDHETEEAYNVTVSVRDSRDDAGDPDTADDATITVTIIVTDEDDPGTITLSSQQPASGLTLTATLDDQDGIKTDVDVTWVWESSSDQTNWTPIDGATTNTYIPLEDDEGDYLRVTATYDDELGQGKTAEAAPTSAVLPTAPTNELPAFADDAVTTLTVLENTPAGENVGDPYTATDVDDTTLTYSLDDQDGASFEVDASGQIKTRSALDYETKDTYTVTVSVHDGKDPFGNANEVADATLDVTINVTDMVIPAVPEEPTVNATRGAAAGLTVAWTAIASPGESPVDGYDVQYRVKDTQNPPAWSSANVTVTGATATITGLEYSTTYEVQVRSKNGEGESDWSPIGEGEIPSLLDVTLSPASRTVDEGSSGTFTVTVSPAADRDLSIPVSASSSNAESGDYSVSGTPLAFASGDASKTFTVSTTNDSDMDDEIVNLAFGQFPASVVEGTQATSQLTIEDTTTAPSTNAVPEFASDATTTLFVPENTPEGENIGDPFTATDDDDTTLTYSLDDQDGASFEVDASGQIKTKSALDYETKDTYAVTVSVHDGRDPFGDPNTALDATAVDATIDVTINVGNIDIPDAPAEPTVTTTRGAAAGLTVSWTAVTATETAPVDGYDVQYRRKDATPPADWSSANVTGATAVITGLEYGTTYEVEVRSKNSEGESDWSPTGEGNIPSRLNVSFSPAGRTINEGSDGTFTVNVDPAADRALNIPITISSSNAESGDYSPTTTTVSFASGDTAKTFPITTTDDSDRDHETLSISFGQLPTAVGTGSQSTATLTINDTTPAPRTKSGGGGGGSNNYRRSSSQVYIPPPSNSAPIFTEGDSTHRSIAENTGSSTTIGSPVSATDADNDTLIYHVGGLDGASFSINPNSGHLLTSSVLDFEVQSSYSVYILVSDGEGGTDRIDVTVFVIDLDETPDPVPLAQVAVPTPEPTPVPPPTEAPTPEPTEEPTPTAVPTAVPTPTTAPTPTAVPTPTTAPTPTAVPTPTTAPTPTNVPTPTTAPTPTNVPTPTAVLPVGELPRVEHQQMIAPPEIVNLGNATQPGVGQTTMTVIPEDLRKFRIWPIILLVLGTAMELMALGLFLKQREIDKRKIWAEY